jgi:hypothetical protein
MKLKALLTTILALSLTCPSVLAQTPRRQPVPAGVVAFVNANVVPMDPEGVLTNQTVVVRGDRVAEVGPAAKVKVPRATC